MRNRGGLIAEVCRTSLTGPPWHVAVGFPPKKCFTLSSSCHCFVHRNFSPSFESFSVGLCVREGGWKSNDTVRPRECRRDERIRWKGQRESRREVTNKIDFAALKRINRNTEWGVKSYSLQAAEQFVPSVAFLDSSSLLIFLYLCVCVGGGGG